MESLRFFSTGGGSNVSLSGTTLTIGDETHTLADPATVASNQSKIANLQTNDTSILESVSAQALQITSLTNQQSTNTNAISTLNGNVSDLQAGSGTDLGTFTGNTITDNQTVKTGMQELETAVEGKSTVALSGTTLTIDGVANTLADPATVSQHTSDISTVNGNVGSNTSAISNLQSVVESNNATNQGAISLNYEAIENLQILTGSGTDLGTFTGNTITDNQTVKAGMQELETAVEGKSTVLPTGSGGTTLTSMTIDGTAYQLGGDVVANPSTAATTDLTKLTVGSTTYDIPGNVRNYQYEVITATNTYVTTSHSLYTNPTWTDVTDVSISITPLRSDSPMRIQTHFFGEVSSHDGDLKFRFKRVQGGATTYVKHSNDLRGTLSVVGHDSSGIGTTQQPWQIIAFDSNDSSGQITYTLQIADHGGGTFYLNQTQSTTNTADHELLNSTIEVEEIMTGPPLQVNSNVVPINPTNGHFIQWNGSAYTTALPILALNDLTNVSTTAPSSGDSLVYSSNQWVPQKPTSPYIKLYKTSNSSDYFQSGNNQVFNFWDAYESTDSSNMFMDSSGNVTVPAGTYLALFHLDFTRAYYVSSSWYYINCGIKNSAGTNFSNTGNDNGKESGLNSGRKPSADVYLQKIITLPTSDILQFYHQIRYLTVTILAESSASLIKIA